MKKSSNEIQNRISYLNGELVEIALRKQEIDEEIAEMAIQEKEVKESLNELEKTKDFVERQDQMPIRNKLTLGKIIKKSRIDGGLSLGECAKLLEITKEHLNKIERDGSKLSFNLMMDIMDLLEITPDELLGIELMEHKRKNRKEKFEKLKKYKFI